MLSGQIMDEHHLPMIGTHISLLPDSILTTSNNDGNFQFDDLAAKTYILQIQYIGYETLIDTIELKKSIRHYHVHLTPTASMLDAVVISEHNKQEDVLSHTHISESFINENLKGNLSQTLEKIPGINAINVGVGIAKPVIRGLSSNRITVNNFGIKQEGQQWGSDHGLELDQFDVEQLEIIKGAGALQYSSDAFGGVINVNPGAIPKINDWGINVKSIYKSNNNHIGNSAKLSFNKNNFFVEGRYTHQAFGDYHVPATQFTYNTFLLPIEDGYLKNTAGIEQNMRLSIGKKYAQGLTRLNVSRYTLDAGLFAGAVGVPRSYALNHDGNHRDIDTPSQNTQHNSITFNQLYFMPKGHFSIDVGYQQNLRQELSRPEFHSIPVSEIDYSLNVATQFDLRTFTTNAHYERNYNEHFKLIYGFNFQNQVNKRAGFEFLLPDFNISKAGIYILQEHIFEDETKLIAGVRGDFVDNRTHAYTQYVYNSNEVITDSLVALPSHQRFYNWSASLGVNSSLGTEHWTFKGNLCKSFRTPYPNETVSNGIHHGTFRHEKGDPNIQEEQGYQIDAAVEYTGDQLQFSISPFTYIFDDYIYLGPAFPAQFSTLPEAGQIFLYQQSNAFFFGGEMNWDYRLKNWELGQGFDFVQTYNFETGLSLPFTPQPALKTLVKYNFEEWKSFSDIFLKVGHSYHLAAQGYSRVDRNELETPAYQLFDLGFGCDLVKKNYQLSFNLSANNLLNTKYFAHLSRYRILDIPEQGRNIVLGINLEI